MRVFLSRCFVGLAVWLVAFLANFTSRDGRADTIAVPAASAEKEAAGQSGVLGGQFRLQDVYAAAQFPAGVVTITEVRFRRDAGVAPIETTIAHLRLSLSTTQKKPDALSNVFATNVGSNEVTVFDGSLRIVSTNQSPPGGPKPFDIAIPFTKPFLYDPAAGNLLLEIRDFSGSDLSRVDASNDGNDGASRAFAFAAEATSAVSTDTGADIVEFVYTNSSSVERPAIGDPVVAPRAFAEKEDDGQSGDLGRQIRLQNVYAADHFPVGRIMIQELRFRRDARVAPTVGVITRLDVSLSTTSKRPDGLGASFADNPGHDETLVFSGAVSITSTNSGPVDGPNPFDIVIPLTRSFLYDSARGNLLLELRNYSGSGLSSVDASNEGNDGASRAFAYDADAITATYVDTGADIVQFIYTDKVPSLLLVPAGGSYSHAIEVRMLSTVTNGTIRYTLDGQEPSLDSPVYQDPLQLAASTTVKARVFLEGSAVSDLVTGTYAIMLALPAITEQPKGASVVAGSTVSLHVAASGSPPLTYQWLRNGVEVSGATNQVLTLVGITLDQAGLYRVRVSNAAGAQTSDAATVAVAPSSAPPVITRQPESRAVALGAAADFTVAATGSEPLFYKWYKNGQPLSGPSGPAWTISSVQKTDAGAYTVEVGNAYGAVTSQPATLTVIDQVEPPVITSTPPHQLADAGSDVTLTVAVTGTAPFIYQWRLNGALITGADSATLSLRNIQAASAGTYTVTVSNGAGAVTSEGTVLDVYSGEKGGTLNFDNHTGSIDAPVFDADGTTRLTGAVFLAQLYAGATPQALAPVGAAVPFLKGPAAGYFSAGASSIRIVASVPAGQTAAAEVRVWEAARGPTYEQALAAGGKAGRSITLSVVTGGGGEPPGLPADLEGLKSFSIARETVPPVITIDSPMAGVTADERAALTGVITDNGAVAAAHWERDGKVMAPLQLQEGRFNVPGLRLQRGENRFRVVATDTVGNQGAAEVVVAWEPSRTLALSGGQDQQEGRRLEMNLVLASQGEVGGLSFIVRYDPEYLRDPELTWSDAVATSISQVNYDTPGQVRATLSVPGSAIPTGTNRIATLGLRARSVPTRTTLTTALEVVDVADQTGNKILFGTDTVPAVTSILPRKFKGDSNGNDRLDIGDATIIQRLVTGLDIARAWDVGANDLNLSQDLDSGDVIKVLRAVVGLDPQPEGAVGPQLASRGAAGLQSASASGVGNMPASGVREHRAGPGIQGASLAPAAVLTASLPKAAPGNTVTVRVSLQGLSSPISGASLKLSYPPEALRLEGPQSQRPGSIVPATAVSYWNVVPSYAAQSGVVSGGIVSGAPWAAANGVLAEFTFQVQPGIVNQFQWPIKLEQIEVTTGNGYEVLPLRAESLLLDSALRLLAQAVQLTKNGLEFSLAGQMGRSYAVEASVDLVHWELLQTLLNSTGTVQFLDPAARELPARFYRIREVN